jgi:hypothetical protein
MSTTDTLAIVERLDPDAIRSALADLDRRSQALRVLLRAAVARRRGQSSRPGTGIGRRQEAPRT